MAGWRDKVPKPTAETPNSSSKRTDASRPSHADRSVSPKAGGGEVPTLNRKKGRKERTAKNGPNSTEDGISVRKVLLFSLFTALLVLTAYFFKFVNFREPPLQIVVASSAEVVSGDNRWKEMQKGNSHFKVESQALDNGAPLIVCLQGVIDQSSSLEARKDIESLFLKCIQERLTERKGHTILVPEVFPKLDSREIVPKDAPERALGLIPNFNKEIKSVYDELRIKEPKLENVLLLLPCQDDENPWVVPELNGSVVQHFLIEMMSLRDGPKATDWVVSLEELESYLQENVGAWCLKHRSAIQKPYLYPAKLKETWANTQLKRCKDYFDWFLGPPKPVQASVISGPTPAILSGRIDSLWAKYDELMRNKAYRYSPEHMAAIAKQLLQLQNSAWFYPEDNKAFRDQSVAVSKLIEAVQDVPNANLERYLLDEASQELKPLAAWVKKGNGEYTLAALKASVDEKSKDSSPKNGSEDGTAGNAATTTETNSDQLEKPSPAASGLSPEKLNSEQWAQVLWLAMLEFPSDGTFQDFDHVFNSIFPRLESFKEKVAIHYLSLVANESQHALRIKSTAKETRVLIGDSVRESCRALEPWIDLVFRDRKYRADAYLEKSTDIQKLTIELQNVLVDRWLAGDVPTLESINTLSDQLSRLNKDLRINSDYYDAVDEFVLAHDSLWSWIISTESLKVGDESAKREKIKVSLLELKQLFETGSSDKSNFVKKFDEIKASLRAIGTVTGNVVSSERYRWIESLNQTVLWLETDLTLPAGSSRSNASKVLREYWTKYKENAPADAALGSTANEITRKSSITSADYQPLLHPSNRTLEKRFSLLTSIREGEEGNKSWREVTRNVCTWRQKIVCQNMQWGDGTEDKSSPFFIRLAEASQFPDEDSQRGTADLLKDSRAELGSWALEDLSVKKYDPMLEKLVVDFEIQKPGLEKRTESLGDVGKLSLWLEQDGGASELQAFAASIDSENCQTPNEGACKLLGRPFTGRLFGSFRGNRFSTDIYREPRSAEFVSLIQQRNARTPEVIVRAQALPKLTVVFAIDFSSSMKERELIEKVEYERIERAERVYEKTVEILLSLKEQGVIGDLKIGIVTFGGNGVKVNTEPREVRGTDVPSFPSDRPDGDTPLYSGLGQAMDELRGNSPGMVVCLTDGVSTRDGDDIGLLENVLKEVPATYCLVLQACTEQSFRQEIKSIFIQEKKKQNDGLEPSADETKQWVDEKFRVYFEGTKNKLEKVKKTYPQRFDLIPLQVFDSSKMFGEIEKLLPNVVATYSATRVDFTSSSSEKLELSKPTLLTLDPQTDLATGELDRWSVEVNVVDPAGIRGSSEPKKISLAPFSTWGNEKWKLDFDLEKMSLVRDDRDVKPTGSQDIDLGPQIKQWYYPQMVEKGIDRVLRIKLGSEDRGVVPQFPELCFAKVEFRDEPFYISEFQYFKDQSSLVMQGPALPQDLFREPFKKDIAFSAKFWPINQASSLETSGVGFEIGTTAITVTDQAKAQVKEKYQNELSCSRSKEPTGEVVVLKLAGPNANTRFLTLIGNTWKKVEIEVGKDGESIQKTFYLRGEVQEKPLKAIVIEEAGLSSSQALDFPRVVDGLRN